MQLRFEYTQQNFGNCTLAGHAAPCGVAVDNVNWQLVPLGDAHCANTDLGITKSASPEPVQAGGSLTYTVTVNNYGPSTATNVKVIDTLPPGVTLVSATGTGWTCVPAGSTVSCTLPSLALGASAFTVTVTAPTGDTTPANNTSSDTLTLTPLADLSITKTDNAGGVAREHANAGVGGRLAAHDGQRAGEIMHVVRVLDEVVGKCVGVESAVG